MRIRRILVPVDFSPHAEVAVQYAMQLARALESKIDLLHAYPLEFAMLPHGHVLPQAVIDEVKASANERLEAVQKRIAQEGLPCERHLSAQYPETAILELATSLPADLIVMGTRGLKGLKHVALGSVAERVVRLAPCPVLAVKAGDL